MIGTIDLWDNRLFASHFRLLYYYLFFSLKTSLICILSIKFRFRVQLSCFFRLHPRKKNITFKCATCAREWLRLPRDWQILSSYTPTHLPVVATFKRIKVAQSSIKPLYSSRLLEKKRKKNNRRTNNNKRKRPTLASRRIFCAWNGRRSATTWPSGSQLVQLVHAVRLT